jgi:transposase
MVKSYKEFDNNIDYSICIFTKKQLFQLCKECNFWNERTLKKLFRNRKSCIINILTDGDNFVDCIKEFIKSRPVGVSEDHTLYINNETWDEINDIERAEDDYHYYDPIYRLI